jgi:hypothetical protein
MNEMDAATGSERTQFNQACSTIRDTVYNTLQQRLANMSGTLDAVTAKVPANYQPVFDKLKQLVVEGKFDDEFSRKNFDRTDLISLNGCFDKGLGGAINDIAKSMNVTPPFDKDGKSAQIVVSPELESLNKEWNTTEAEYSVYTYLNESAYMPKVNAHESIEGHTQDNAYEMSASLVNLAINRRDSLVSSLRSMTTSNREMSLMAITVSLRMASKNASPEGRAYFQSIESQITAGASTP